MDLAQSTKVVPGQMVTPDFGKINLNAPLEFIKNQLAVQQAGAGIASNKAVSMAIKDNTDQDGNLNVPGIITQLSKDENASYNLPELATKLLALKGQQFTTDTANLTNLATKNSLAGQRLAPLVANINEGKPVTRDQIVNEFVHLNRIGVFSPQEAAKHMATLPAITGNKEKDQEALHNWVTNEHRATLNNETLFSKLLPSQTAVGTGSGTQMFNVNPLTGKSTPTAFIQNEVAPGTKIRLEEGNPYGLPANTEVIMPSSGRAPTIINQGGINQGGTQPQGQPTPSAPNKPMVTALAPTTEKNIETGLNLIEEARKQSDLLPTLVFNAGKIIKYAKGASTGTGAELLNDIKGNFAGLPYTFKSVNDFNSLGHQLAIMNKEFASLPGINGTNAGQELASKVGGSTKWDEQSIIDATRVNRSLAEMNNLFYQGVKKYRNDTQKAIDFKDKWNNILNVDTIRLYDASKNKVTDPDALKSVIKDLGEKRAVEAAKHIDKINDLITKGQ